MNPQLHGEMPATNSVYLVLYDMERICHNKLFSCLVIPKKKILKEISMQLPQA
jgi:hypothetical protein